MSRNTVERALYQLCVDRAAKQRFRDDAAAFLERYALSDEERAMVLNFEVAQLQAYGVNPMLTMGYWQELSPQRGMRAYMTKLRGDDGGPVHSASLKG